MFPNIFDLLGALCRPLTPEEKRKIRRKNIIFAICVSLIGLAIIAGLMSIGALIAYLLMK